MTVKQPVNALIYVENIYEGELSKNSLKAVESIPWDDWIKVWLDLLGSISNLNQDCEIGLRLTGDRQIQALNRQYRSIDQPTDVLAFAATEANVPLPQDIAEPLYLGDVIISLDTAEKQAQEQNHLLTTELAWLASHGVLHLLGWDHPDEVSLEKMLKQQSKLVQLSTIHRRRSDETPRRRKTQGNARQDTTVPALTALRGQKFRKASE